MRELLAGIYDEPELTVVISEVLQAITSHRADGQPLSLEAGILRVADHDDLRRITLALAHRGDAVMLLPVEAFSALGVQRSGYIRLHCAFSLHWLTAL